MDNVDQRTVSGFGFEWKTFDQSKVSVEESARLFEGYFCIFPWEKLSRHAVGIDIGCGSGRWALQVAPKVGFLHCVDASAPAISVARCNLAEVKNCDFHFASVNNIPIDDSSLDFGYSLGVLHHVPDTAAAILSCVQKLKLGAPFLIYLYYALENRPAWFRLIWESTNLLRRFISRCPQSIRLAITQIIAATIYYPVARISMVAELAGLNVNSIPLSFYRTKSFYTMRTDALDRFGTSLEQRFTANQIRGMMERAGLGDIKFSDRNPLWCAVGYRQS